jgi:2-keto-4-pentenoate hydratase
MFAADQVAQLLIHSRLANAKLQARLEVASLVEAKLLVAEIIRMGRQLTPFGRQLGWKVGATNDSSLKSLGLSAPFYGPLYENHCFSSQLIKSIELNRFGRFRAAEAEFCFRMKDSLPPRSNGLPYRIGEVYDRIECVIPAIEIAATRFECDISTPLVVGDFAMNGCCIMGNEVSKPADHNYLSTSGASLHINDSLVSSSTGSNVLGNPVQAVTFLANELNKDGYELSTGDIVMSGACCVCKVEVGDRLVAQFVGLSGSTEYISVAIS